MLPHELLGCLNVSIDSGKSVPIVSAPPIPSAPADLELIAQLKSKLQYAELRIRLSLLILFELPNSFLDE